MHPKDSKLAQCDERKNLLITSSSLVIFINIVMNYRISNIEYIYIYSIYREHQRVGCAKRLNSLPESQWRSIDALVRELLPLGPPIIFPPQTRACERKSCATNSNERRRDDWVSSEL